jgi:uncharacterized Zn-binding protein involved in type VI secretion
MTQPVTRLGDICTGHGCWPPRASNGASPNVFANAIPVHRQTDGWSVHCCGPACHGSTLQAGSTTVFANGLAVGRITDPVACGSSVSTGSDSVYAG